MTRIDDAHRIAHNYLSENIDHEADWVFRSVEVVGDADDAVAQGIAVAHDPHLPHQATLIAVHVSDPVDDESTDDGDEGFSVGVTEVSLPVESLHRLVKRLDAALSRGAT